MTGFSLLENYTDNPERLVRRARPRVVPPLAILPAQEPIQEAPLVPKAMAEKTLREFSVPSTDNVATGPNINVGDMNFELKSSLINLVQAIIFFFGSHLGEYIIPRTITDSVKPLTIFMLLKYT